MKKQLIIIMLLVMVSMIWGESVILNDGRTLKGEVVGKKGDLIYLDSEGNIYLIKRDLIKEIKNDGDQPITGLIFRKKDFMDEYPGGISITEITPVIEEGIRDNDVDGIYVNGMNINDLDIRYCEIVAEDKRFFAMFRKFKQISINIDYGQQKKQRRSHSIEDASGNEIKFNSLVDAFNFLDKFNWEFVTQYGITYESEVNIYHFLFKRKMPNP